MVLNWTFALTSSRLRYLQFLMLELPQRYIESLVYLRLVAFPSPSLLLLVGNEFPSPAAGITAFLTFAHVSSSVLLIDVL